MTDKLVGVFLIVIVLAMVAIGSFATYSMFGTPRQTTDTYGDQFSNRTNQTTAVENAVAPVSITIEGYMVFMGVILGVVGAGILVFKAVGGGGSSSRGVR